MINKKNNAVESGGAACFVKALQISKNHTNKKIPGKNSSSGLLILFWYIISN